MRRHFRPARATAGQAAGLGRIGSRDGLGRPWCNCIERSTGKCSTTRFSAQPAIPEAILPSIEQFDYYSGGGVDIAFLGTGEADSAGNVNVSHLGGTLIGPGGFVEIAQYAKKEVFCGTFDAQGTRMAWDAAAHRLMIQQPGRIRKFVREVERITFSGDFARRTGQEVLYVTERAVFRLTPTGLALIELAPGIEPERDLLPFMDFQPEIVAVAQMPTSVFS
jgi:acyl CoA:acetate/3-ketoacid CoA transferase